MTEQSDDNARIVLDARERDLLASVIFRTEGGPSWQEVLQAVEGILTDRRLVRFACETHLCGACGGCKAAKVRDLLSDAQATEAVLRGEIRRSESALATFDDVVAQRDALTRALVKRTKKKNLPTIPIGTRVRVHDSGAAGVGTVVGKDGYGFDGVSIIFDEPAPRGFEDGCCAGVEQCEPLTRSDQEVT